MTQITFGTDGNDFADNPEPRCPCVLLLDVSYSMKGQALDALNRGLQVFRDELASDSLAMKRVEVGIVTFGPTKVEMPFVSAENFHAPTLVEQGDTPMGSAILEAINMINARKQEYKANGISYYRPWIFMITDGGPTDSWALAAQAVREGEEKKQFAFFAVGVEGANFDTLGKISSRSPIKLDGLKFRELFSWLSSSMRSVSQSTPNTEVPLAPPTGWASV